VRSDLASDRERKERWSMNEFTKPPVHERWAHLRFSVVGPLLAAPQARGELQAALEALAAKSWLHPVSGTPIQFGVSTIERWYHQARGASVDPVGRLRRKVRRDAGQQPAVGESFRPALLEQYAAHRGWSYQLHYDNLAAVVRADAARGPLPSYATLRRFMKAHGLLKQRRFPDTPGGRRAAARLEQREVRSFEAEYVHGLWHLDFHHGSKKVLTPAGEWVTPLLLGVLDDRSRLACHVQWYLGEETAEHLVHGLAQAFQKRGLPRALMTDNGAAMIAAEVTQGLTRLGIVHQPTLPHSPYQNAKQEVFWAQVEGRLVAMLEGVADLTLAVLNDATQAWVELEYQRAVHSETRQSPLERCDLDRLARAFDRPIAVFLPANSQPVSEEQSALLSATGDLPPEDIEELLQDHHYNLLAKVVRRRCWRSRSVRGRRHREFRRAEPPSRTANISRARSRSAGAQRNPNTGELTNALYSGSNSFVDEDHPYRTWAPPNLTSTPNTGRLAKFTEEAFVARVRAGRIIPGSPMPCQAFARMTDDDLPAIYRFLKTLPPVENEVGPVMVDTRRRAHIGLDLRAWAGFFPLFSGPLC
jgi:transposase InsO family protein